MESDAGPPSGIAEVFARVPDYTKHLNHFWFDWGPILYRGRLDGSARLLCVASDPGPTELLEPIELDPITVSDDGSFLQNVAEQMNLPASIKEGLPELY